MKLLLIGGTGYIGRHLINQWSNKYELLVMARNIDDSYFSSQKHVQFIQGDISNRSSVFDAMRGVDYVVHLASTSIPSTSNDNCIYDVNTNLVGSLNVLDACAEHKIKKLIFSSSGGTVYGNSNGMPLAENTLLEPICSYGIVKAAIENYIKLYYKNYNTPYAILRISNPYGPGHNSRKGFGVINNFINKIKTGSEIEIWGDGTISRDFIYIDDLVRAFDLALTSTRSDLLLNIGSGVLTSLNEILEMLIKITNAKPVIKYLDVRSCDVNSNILNIQRSKLQLNWQPVVSLNTGLQVTAEELLV